ncbi:MAG: flagellar hook-length control protein FliK [Lysobacter sp.]
MASGVGGGGAATGADATSASSPPATAPHGNGRNGNPRQDTFAGLLAGVAPADAAAEAKAAAPPLPTATNPPTEDAANDDGLAEQIFNLIGGAWPATTPSPVGVNHTAGDGIDDPLTAGELPMPILPIDQSPVAIADASDAATNGPLAGKAGSAQAPAAASVGLTLPLAVARAADGADASADPAITIGQATGTDATTKAAFADADGAAPLDFVLSGQQVTASSPSRSAAPTLIGAAVAMPADPDAGFDDSFGARIGWMAEQRIGHAQIRVSPDHVGPIDVRLQLDGTRVSAEFISANADVRQALEASVGRLRDLLDQQGLQLSHSDVGSGQPGTSGERAPTDIAGTRGFGDDGGTAVDLPAPILMRRGLLDEYA